MTTHEAEPETVATSRPTHPRPSPGPPPAVVDVAVAPVLTPECTHCPQSGKPRPAVAVIGYDTTHGLLTLDPQAEVHTAAVCGDCLIELAHIAGGRLSGLAGGAQ